MGVCRGFYILTHLEGRIKGRKNFMVPKLLEEGGVSDPTALMPTAVPTLYFKLLETWFFVKGALTRN